MNTQCVTDPKRLLKYEILFCLTYFTSYMTRINYAASMTAIMADLDLTKTMAGIAVTGCFISYGVGQIISGKLGDIFQPHRIVECGLGLTCVCNLIMPFLSNVASMTAVWTINGFAQSMLWPPIVRMVSVRFPREKYGGTIMRVAISSSIATIITYLTVPVWLGISGWRLCFILPAMLALVLLIVWLIKMRGEQFPSLLEERKAAQAANAAADIKPWKISSILLLVWPFMAAMALQGLLRDGIITWMPNYITEVYNLGASASILSTAVLPCFSILSHIIALAVYRKFHGEMRASRLFFGSAAVCAVLLYIFFGRAVVFAIIMMMIITGCMHAANMIISSYPPTYFPGSISTVSGLINACTYIGSAVSAYGFAAISEESGWGSLVLIWAFAAAAAFIVLLFNRRKWQQHVEKIR